MVVMINNVIDFPAIIWHLSNPECAEATVVPV